VPEQVIEFVGIDGSTKSMIARDFNMRPRNRLFLAYGYTHPLKAIALFQKRMKKDPTEMFFMLYKSNKEIYLTIEGDNDVDERTEN
jgi:hypothetical protein